MYSDMIHAIVLIQTWGKNSEVIKMLANNNHIISLFHVMGRDSFLLDTNFDNKEQLEGWLNYLKSAEMPSKLPAVLTVQTQRIIDVNKQKKDFSLQNYIDMKEKYHFFVKIDNPHHDDALLKVITGSEIVHSVLHIQGDNSFTIEVITGDYDKYRQLLNEMKELSTIHHIETQEVISVLKYRNVIMDEQKSLLKPDEDIRELFTL